MWCTLALLGIAAFVAFYIFYKLFEYALRKPFIGGIHSKYVLVSLHNVKCTTSKIDFCGLFNLAFLLDRVCESPDCDIVDVPLVVE